MTLDAAYASATVLSFTINYEKSGAIHPYER